MAIVDDDMKEDPVYSILLDSLNSNQKETLSPEDLAWADSCLNNDVDSSNADWSSVQDALLEILSTQVGPPSSAAGETSGRPTDYDVILPFRENATSLEFGRGSDDDEDLIDDVAGEVESIEISEDEEEDLLVGKKSVKVKGKNRVDNPFRPNYSEDVLTVDNRDSSLDLGLTTYEVEPSFDELFQVWDLGIPDEQDDFSKQLDKALAEVPPQTHSTADNSMSLKDFTNVSVDDLIAGIDGLSLMPNAN